MTALEIAEEVSFMTDEKHVTGGREGRLTTGFVWVRLGDCDIATLQAMQKSAEIRASEHPCDLFNIQCLAIHVVLESREREKHAESRS